ncbi:MAG: undecaprenyl-phosphate glucose phosphotransferase [Planctomycetota bacterium]
MNSPAPIQSHRQWWDFLQPVLDASAILGSLAAVKWITRGYFDELGLFVGMIAVVVFLLSSQLTGLHRRTVGGSADSEVSMIAATWGLTILVLAMLGFATRYGQEFARSNIAFWFILAPALVGLGRMCLRIVQRGLLRRGVGVRRVAIAGLNDLGRQTAMNIENEPALGLRMCGFFDDRTETRAEKSANDEASDQRSGIDETLQGDLTELVHQAREGTIDTVMITLPMRAEERIRYLLDQLSDSTASVYIVPDFFVFELLHSRWTNMGGLPAVSVFENPLFGVDGLCKRIADVTLAIAGLIVASIPMLMIAFAVKLSSKGPVFFRQRRYGLDGKVIRVWKFRSMRTCDDGGVVKQATKGDPRVTRVGAVLRKTSLDELPQLFNVIDGSMSLVGPRPHASAHNEQYRSLIRGYMLRHKVKPGITGLAQVNGCRGETDTIDKMERRIEWDHRYIRGWSFWLDLKILFRTVFIVWKQPEAY